MICISKCSLLQKDYNETGVESPRNSHIYHLFSISDMLMIEIVFKMSHMKILLFQCK